jgi:O-antigen ligase
MSREVNVRRISQVLLWVAPAVTLFVSPFMNYDPISLPKMAVLSTVSFAVLGVCLFSDFKELINKSKTFSVLTALFIISMLIPMIASGSNVGQQFWGAFGRNTGFLTYLSLAILAWAASNASSDLLGEKALKSLIVTAMLVTAYCLVQIGGYDPIKWSLMDTFATLGNINFLSAFLGLSTTAALAILLGKKMTLGWRISCTTLLLSGLPIIWSTGSIQGLMMFVLGAYLILFFLARSILRSRIFTFIYFFIGILGTYVGLRGLRNEGPLSSFLYQPSVAFREDYMHAGWEMMLLKPWTGVGLDSFGDWYRQVRGEISTLRTDPDRVSNSAHNIFLDVASGGGVIVVLLYLSFYIFCFIQCFRYIRKNNGFDPIFVALFSSWCAYILQALISINQIGVGVWGALLLGALVRYTRLIEEKSSGEVKQKEKAKVSGRLKDEVLPAKVALGSYLVAAIGFTAAFFPLKIDSDFSKASTPDLSIAVSKSSLARSFYKELTLEKYMQQSRFVEAKDLAMNIVQQYPRSFYAWKMLSILPNSTPGEIEAARAKMRELDPYNPNVG